MKKGEGKLPARLILTQEKVNSFLDAKYRKHKSKATVDKYTYCLAHFQSFLLAKYPKERYTLETILPLLSQKKISVYSLLNEFISYLEEYFELTAKSIVDYISGIRTYLLFQSEFEIDLTRFKDRVSLPDLDTGYEEAIDANIIRKILNSCNNRRLRPLLYLLGTSGVRAMEAISLRWKDVELSDSKTEPSIIHVRKEFSKSRRPRNVFITPEATEELKRWKDYKYSERQRYVYQNGNRKHITFRLPYNENHIIFASVEEPRLDSIYVKLRIAFNKILETIELDQRKEGMKRRRITFHSFRRFVKTILTDQVNERFAEYTLGHKNDMGCHTKRPEEAFENYKQVMPYLTFTDFAALESYGRSNEAKIQQLERENQYLREHDASNEAITKSLGDELSRMMKKEEERDLEIAELRKKSLDVDPQLLSETMDRLIALEKRLKK